MTSSIWNIILPAITGFAGILFGSFRPIIDWHIEKRRIKIEERKKLLKEMRQIMVHEKTTQWLIVNSLPYSQLRPMLPKDLVAKLEKTDKEFEFDGTLRWGLAPQLADAVNEIEKKWGLL